MGNDDLPGAWIDVEMAGILFPVFGSG